MPKSQKKEKENAKKNKKIEEHKQGKCELNIVTSKDRLPDNTDDTVKDSHIDSGSKISLSVEKGENCDCLKQGMSRSTNFCSITDIKDKNSEVSIEGKTKKDLDGIFEETLPNKQKQKIIHGEYDNLGVNSLSNNSNRTLMDNNVNNTNTTNNEDYHVCKGISKRFDALVDLCKELGNDTSEKCNESNIRMDQKDSFEEELPDQQQYIDGKSELNMVTCEDSLPDNFDHILNDNIINCGSKLWARDEKDGNYCITQGMPRSIKFRSIDNIYKCTNSLSPVEVEFNWNHSTKEDSNMNHLAKEDASIKTNKENIDCERKGRENKNENEEKLDAATSST